MRIEKVIVAANARLKGARYFAFTNKVCIFVCTGVGLESDCFDTRTMPACKTLPATKTRRMKKTLLIAGLFLLFFNSCDKDSDWIVLYGELNDNLAYKEVNGNYYYDNIEYFFISKKSKKCYRNLDTNNFRYAKNLLDSKLSQLDKNKIDERVFMTANITKQAKDFINIEFIDDKGRQILYKINLLDKDNDNVFVYAKHKDQYIECMWTDRKSRTRKTKKLSEL